MVRTKTDIIKKVETGGKGDDEGQMSPEPEGGQDVPAPDSANQRLLVRSSCASLPGGW